MNLALPAISTAALPAAYENAKTALATCERLDECRDWANKMDALASYARQSDDDTLMNQAMRIKARAIRRCGELLKEIKPAPNQHVAEERARGGAPPSRASAARDAGLSDDQRKQALRVASIPQLEFEAAIEAPQPPTITELAERGTVARPAVIDVPAPATAPKPLLDIGNRDPMEFRASTDGQGHIRRLAEFAARVSPDVVVRGAYAHELAALVEHAKTLAPWLNQIAKIGGD